ncbi:MAG TPA: serine/threonine-protein kinase, partial [Polyangiaceae bacterium]|nr:serine/threonine-protein kinase [Polyangiaceae bacterium]
MLREGGQIDGFVLGPRVHVGGMSALYRVTKAGEQRPLVMKVPLLGAGAPREAVVAFETEAAIVPTLTGPHVPAFVAAGDLEGTPYLVTEWVEGQALEDRLTPGGLEPAGVARLGAALADALHSVHVQGVIHLDLKPANVIVRGDATAVLIDFGFAHREGHADLIAEETRFALGSAPYVSPEQLLGSRRDPRSDLFALGVVLYELATGELPFGEPDADVRNRFWLDPVPPSARSPAVPPWLQEVILRSLEPSAERRHASAALVAFDLRHPEQVALGARASKTARVGPLAHLRRFVRARTELGARLRSPEPLPSQTPIVLVAVDTGDIDDPRHEVIRGVVTKIVRLSDEFRLLVLSVIAPSEPSLEHVVRLRRWAAPLGVARERLSLHAIESSSVADVIVE